MVDRVTALRPVRALNIPLNERARLGAGLTAAWSIRPTATIRPTDPITVKLRVKNAGTTTMGFVVGGGSAGRATDNRLSFAISRNGTPGGGPGRPGDPGPKHGVMPSAAAERKDLWDVKLTGWAASSSSSLDRPRPPR